LIASDRSIECQVISPCPTTTPLPSCRVRGVDLPSFPSACKPSSSMYGSPSVACRPPIRRGPNPRVCQQQILLSPTSLSLASPFHPPLRLSVNNFFVLSEPLKVPPVNVFPPRQISLLPSSSAGLPLLKTPLAALSRSSRGAEPFSCRPGPSLRMNALLSFRVASSVLPALFLERGGLVRPYATVLG